jgi:hypothetical protein
LQRSLLASNERFTTFAHVVFNRRCCLGFEWLGVSLGKFIALSNVRLRQVSGEGALNELLDGKENSTLECGSFSVVEHFRS